MAPMCIPIHISETTLGSGFGAHLPRRPGFACNHVIQLAHYCVTSFGKPKEIGGAEQTTE